MDVNCEGFCCSVDAAGLANVECPAAPLEGMTFMEDEEDEGWDEYAAALLLLLLLLELKWPVAAVELASCADRWVVLDKVVVCAEVETVVDVVFG